MRSLFSKILKSPILGSLSLIILGILLIFRAALTIVSISYVIGGILIALGSATLLKFIKNTKNKNANQLDLIYGMVSIILGVVVISNPQAIASIIPFVLGFIIIINSARKLQYSLELKQNKNELWKSTMIMAIVTTICGVVLVINPFKGVVFITKIVGFLILIYAVLDIISTIIIKSTVKQIHTAIEETIVDAKIIEEEDETPKKRKNKKSKNKSEKNKEDNAW